VLKHFKVLLGHEKKLMNLPQIGRHLLVERAFSQPKDTLLEMMAKRVVPEVKDVAINLAHLRIGHWNALLSH
jgi:hypothetical protein